MTTQKKRSRRTFAPDFKASVVELLLEGGTTIGAVSSANKVSREQVRKWRTAYEAGELVDENGESYGPNNPARPQSNGASNGADEEHGLVHVPQADLLAEAAELRARLNDLEQENREVRALLRRYL